MTATGRDLRPRWIDAAFAVVQSGVLVLAMAARVESGDRGPDAVGVTICLLLGAVLLLRRRAPRVVLAATLVLLAVYYTAQYPPVGMALPIAGALFSVAEVGRWRLGAATGLAMLVVSVVVRLAEGEDATQLLAFDTAPQLALIVAVLALGDTVRSRRRLRADARRQAERAEADHRRDTAARIGAERQAVSREVHDALAHSLAAITVQADLALESFDDDPAVARTAVREIRTAGRAGLADVRRTVAALRGGGTAPTPGIDGLDELVGTAGAGGLRVRLSVDTGPGVLPAAVGAAVHRIVQEALTNVVRHSAAATAEVELRRVGGVLELRITDPGPARATGTGSGFGLVGMQERAHLLGGTFHAGPTGEGTFRIDCSLPVPLPDPAGPVDPLPAGVGR
ncbi:sensor histidine kinase [Nakamurella alba]|nr:sensor histidine kinase [Nakamurella alba]